MKKLTITLLAMLCFSVSALSQDGFFSVKAGAIGATFTGDNATNIDSRTSFTGGAAYVLPLSDSFAANLGLNYSNRGSKDGSATRKMSYVDLQPQFQFFTGRDSDQQVGFYLELGPRLSFNVSDKLYIDGDDVGGEANIKGADFGGTFVIGGNLRNGLVIESTLIDYSFSSFPDIDNVDAHHLASTLMLGYNFNQ